MGEIERLLRVAEDKLSYVQKQRQFLLDQIASLKREKDNLLHPSIEERPIQLSVGPVTNQSCEEAKIALFRSLFRGREDVYARRFESRTTGKSGYQPDCGNEWLPGICQKPKIKCSHCDQRQFIHWRKASALQSMSRSSPREEFRRRARSVKAMIRTGDFTAYSNTLLVSGGGPRWCVERRD